MKQATPVLVLLALTCTAGANETIELDPQAQSLADRCDAIVAEISAHYTQSFDEVVARKTPRSAFSAALAEAMNRHIETAGMGEYGQLWQAHFAAVGDQLAPELIEGYIQYQCRTDSQGTPIEATSDRIDAECWNVADDGKMEILNARMRHKDATDLRRLSRAKILACITVSLNQQTDR